ncbi:MAG: hypothetical protein ACE5KI_05290 [Dehalococcoidia bacterium]
MATTATVTAQEESSRRGVYGTVISISEDGTTAVVLTRSGTEVTIDLTTTDLDLSEGDQVALLVQAGEEGEPYQVLRGLVRPDRPQFQHLTGAVVSKTATSIIIVDATGREHVVELPEGVDLPVNAGDLATVITSNGNGEDGDGGPSVAQAGITAQAIADHVRAHAETLRGRAEAGEVPVTTADERIEFLDGLLDTISNHVQTVLGDLLSRVATQAQDAIQSAMDKAMEGFQRAKAGVAQQMGPPEEAGPPEDIPSGPPE